MDFRDNLKNTKECDSSIRKSEGMFLFVLPYAALEHSVRLSGVLALPLC